MRDKGNVALAGIAHTTPYVLESNNKNIYNDQTKGAVPSML